MPPRRIARRFCRSATMSVRIIPLGAPADLPVSDLEIVRNFSPASERCSSNARVTVRGKFLWVGEEKVYIRGATYVTFRLDIFGVEFPSPGMLEQPCSSMSAND